MDKPIDERIVKGLRLLKKMGHTPDQVLAAFNSVDPDTPLKNPRVVGFTEFSDDDIRDAKSGAHRAEMMAYNARALRGDFDTY